MDMNASVAGNARERHYTPFAFGQDLLLGGVLWHDVLVALRETSSIPSRFAEFHIHQVAGPPPPSRPRSPLLLFPQGILAGSSLVISARSRLTRRVPR